jgi:tetratricopeptide (TPR) repeat protein
MKTKPPPERRKFAGVRDKAAYLYERLLYWFDEGNDPSRAHAYAQRLDELLSKECPDNGAIFPEECRSLICEVRGDLAGAIEHRENEIRLINRLHEISIDRPHWDKILELHGYEDLSIRMDWLSELYHESGQIERAVETLQESKRLCAEHGVRFGAADLLREFSADLRKSIASRKRSTHQLNGRPAK